MNKTDKLTSYICKLERLPVNFGTIQEMNLIIHNILNEIDRYKNNNIVIHPIFNDLIYKTIDKAQEKIERLGI